MDEIILPLFYLKFLFKIFTQCFIQYNSKTQERLDSR